jgi:hypothetical protein
MLAVGTVSTFTSTRLTGYLQLFFSNAFTWYPYRAYIESLLIYGPAAKESHLNSVMWYKDTPGQQDKRTTDNKGFTARKKLTALSKSVQMNITPVN